VLDRKEAQKDVRKEKQIEIDEARELRENNSKRPRVTATRHSEKQIL
jgi:hypothetical protein